MILLISLEDSLIFFMDSTISCILPLLSTIPALTFSTSLLMLLAFSAFCWTISDTLSRFAVNSSVTAAWSVAPCASSMALVDTCPAPSVTSSATFCILSTVSAIFFSKSINEFKIWIKSPFHSTWGWTSKSPSENNFIALPISSTYVLRMWIAVRRLSAIFPISSSEW